MSDAGDCASQEIEATTSSNSTRNSRKCTFVQSILKTEKGQIACSGGPSIIFGRERVPELPVLEKNDFIQNWIIAHSSLADSPEKLSPGSPILGISSAKRSPQSPILGYQWKRTKREPGSKENCRVSLNKKFQQVRPNPLVTARIVIEHEVCSNNDVDKTLNSTNSPVLNKITNSPSFNTSHRSCRFETTRSPSKSDADSTLRWDDHKSLVRANTMIPETLSLSSPLCNRNNPFKNVGASNYPKQATEAVNKQLLKYSELLVEDSAYDVEVIASSSKIPETLSLSSPLRNRNNPFKKVDASNYPKQGIEAVNKQLLKYSELLVEDSACDVEVISSSSKIPETLSHSTTGDEYGELKPDSKENDLPKYDLQTDDITKLEKLHHSPSSSSSIKIEAETSSEHDRSSQGHESSSSSVRLSISSRFRKKKLRDSKSYTAAWIRTQTSPASLETVKTLQGVDLTKKIQESSSIPDTLSVSSQLRGNLIPESSNTLYRLSIPSPLRKKNVIVSSPLVESLLPEFSDAPHRLSISSPLKRKKPFKSNKTSAIRATNSSINSGRTRTLHGSEQSKKNGASSHIPDTLTVSSQLCQTLVLESSDSPDRLSNHALLRQKIFEGLNANSTSLIKANNSSIGPKVVDTLQEFAYLNTVRESLQIVDTLSVSSQLNEIVLPESSDSPNPSSLSTSLAKYKHVGITSVNPPIMGIKDGPTFELSQPLSERIDVESNVTNAPEDDIKIESDSDCTISDFIENPVTQNVTAVALENFSRVTKDGKLEERSQDLADGISTFRQDNSYDPDETCYSDGDPIPRLRLTKVSPLKNSQKISQSTSQSHESRIISQVDSPLKNSNCGPPSNVMSRHTMNNNNTKKKKGKKGSLVAKLEAIVNSQVSKLRIWRYQMSQPAFKNAGTQFVKLKIRERETRYGRHFLTASVIEDSQDLLKSIFESESNLSSEKGRTLLEISTITLVMVPEIIGVVKIPAQSILKIYQPWEIMDRNRKILSVMFFNVGAPEEANVDNEAVVKCGSRNVIQEFECPCIRAKTLVDSCPEKFSNTKTSVMQAMFSS